MYVKSPILTKSEAMDYYAKVMMIEKKDLYNRLVSEKEMQELLRIGESRLLIGEAKTYIRRTKRFWDWIEATKCKFAIEFDGRIVFFKRHLDEALYKYLRTL